MVRSGTPADRFKLSLVLFLTATTTMLKPSALICGGKIESASPWMGFVQFLNCFGCLVAACSAARAEMAADSLILFVLLARGAETSELGNRVRLGAMARRSVGFRSAHSAGGALSSTPFGLGFSPLVFSFD